MVVARNCTTVAVAIAGSNSKHDTGMHCLVLNPTACAEQCGLANENDWLTRSQEAGDDGHRRLAAGHVVFVLEERFG